MNKTWFSLSALEIFSHTALREALTPMKDVAHAQIGAMCESTKNKRTKYISGSVNRKKPEQSSWNFMTLTWMCDCRSKSMLIKSKTTIGCFQTAARIWFQSDLISNPILTVYTLVSQSPNRIWPCSHWTTLVTRLTAGCSDHTYHRRRRWVVRWQSVACTCHITVAAAKS